MTKYLCPNFGNCDSATSKEVFERDAGQELKCPHCQTALELHPSEQAAASPGGAKAGGPRTPVVVAAGVGLLVAVGAVAMVLQKPKAEAPVVASAPARPAAVSRGPQVATAPSTISPSASEVESQKAFAQVKLETGDSKGAEAQSAKAAANEMVKLGIAQLGQGKLNEAEKSFASALLVDPKQSLAYYNMAVLRLRQGRADDALQQFEASFMNGFAHFKQLDDDRDLDPIRQNKRFTELVARYRQGPSTK